MEGIPGPGAYFYSKFVTNSPFIKDFYQMVEDEVGAKLPSGRLLDIGTGPGRVPLAIARKLTTLVIDAIDISSAMVDIATGNARKAGLEQRVKFQYGSAEKIPFEDGVFDLVMATLSFHHWAKPEECLKEVRRVLKPGGELWIYEFKWDLTPENKEQVKKKYGPVLAFMVLNMVRSHSSISFSKIQQVQSYKDIGFSEITAEDKGIFVKLKLVKQAIPEEA
jgi:ubiquinone/menaquinone biosynthesis C-methylase UbiE